MHGGASYNAIRHSLPGALMSGVSQDDRQSIARGVVVAIVIVALCFAGVFFFLDRWADKKLEPLFRQMEKAQRSNAAHYGNHKKALEELKENLR